MTSRAPCLGLALIVCGSTLVSCTSVLGIEDTKYEQSAVPASEDWSCVGSARPGSNKTSIKLTVKTVPFFSATADPVPGIEIRTCTLLSGCETDALATTPDGTATVSKDLPVQGSFVGYLEFRDPKGVYKTLRWMFSQPVIEDLNLVVLMAGKDDLATFAGGLDAPGGGALGYDASKGVLTFSAVGCAMDKGVPVPAANAAVSVEPRNAEAALYYFDGQTFESETARQVTFAPGRGAIFNVTPGKVRLSVKHGGKTVASQDKIPVEADSITTVDMFPDRSAL